MPSAVALIPARSGSKRAPGKNIRPLAGHPLLAYTIRAAIDSGVFDAVIVSTDSWEYCQIAREYGARVPFLRPDRYAADLSPDYDWVLHALSELGGAAAVPKFWDAFAILRPTSPFRQPETIRRAWTQWLEHGERFDSLRAIEPAKQHPMKMWCTDWDNPQTEPMTPWEEPQEPYFERFMVNGQPHHSVPTQLLPKAWVQNASLEIAWTRVVTEHSTISGDRVMPFFTAGREGYDINTEDDWALAEHLIATGQATLPAIPAELSFTARGT